MSSSDYKVGDKLVRFGRVYQIFKIKERQINGEADKQEPVVYFKPFYQTKKDRTLTCSIPLESIEKTSIRRPISKKKLTELLQHLAKKPARKYRPINITKKRGVCDSNQPEEIAKILKRLWLEKHDEDINFTASKREVFQLSMRRLLEEVALVSGLSLAKAEAKLEEALAKAVS